MGLDNNLIRLRANAKKAGVPNYGSMSASELREALAGGTSSKRKSATSVKSSKRKSASAVSKPERKQTRKAKRKQASSTSEEMTEKQAKRIVKKYEGKRGRRPAEYHEAQAVLGEDTPQSKPASKRKPGRPKGSGRKTTATRASRNGDAGRNLIDKANIDWDAEWSGGQRGTRGMILKALRRFKGNYAKVQKHLEPNVQTMYTKSQKTGHKYTKAEAIAMLKWNIGRVAFDFVMGTNQHKIATNRKTDKRSGGKRKSAAKVVDNGNVKDLTDQKLKRIVKASEGKRGRKSAEVHAAIAELERRSGKSAKGKATPSGSKRKTSAKGRRGPGRPRGSTKKRATGKARRTVKR